MAELEDPRQYVPRLLDRIVGESLDSLRALMIAGPRAAGKTTTAARYAATVVRLDEPGVGEVFRSSPDAALAGLTSPILLDEWQAVPEVLSAVKRAVDTNPEVRFLLTGSVDAPALETGWPGTGRVVDLPMYGLTEREVGGSIDGPGFLNRLARASVDAFPAAAAAPTVRDYVRLALRSGFPEPALRLAGDDRLRWLSGYVNRLISRDVPEAAGPRDPARLRRYLEVLALNTGGSPSRATLLDAAQIDAKTSAGYDRLLRSLYVVDEIPAWSTQRLQRLTQAPKRFVTDPSLMGALLGLGENAFFFDANLLGRLIETFVLAQIRPELALSPVPPRLYHLRDQRGREVDLLAEISGLRLLAIEIKAKGAVTRHDARHIAWLRDQTGDRFVAGAVLHTGPIPYRLEDRILALPIYSLWTPAERPLGFLDLEIPDSFDELLPEEELEAWGA